MKKSVYSLVLMDDVIKAVDRQAYLLGTNRSNLINQILAEHLSCVTPEMKMREIFDTVENIFGSSFLIQKNSDSLMTIKTVLEYKYRPTVSYRVELFRVPENFLGNIKVRTRTKNKDLSVMLEDFFGIRNAVEKKCLSEIGVHSEGWKAVPEGFSRKIINSADTGDFTAGEAIVEYLNHLDRYMKIFLSGDIKSFSDMERTYSDMLKKFVI